MTSQLVLEPIRLQYATLGEVSRCTFKDFSKVFEFFWGGNTFLIKKNEANAEVPKTAVPRVAT